MVFWERHGVMITVGVTVESYTFSNPSASTNRLQLPPTSISSEYLTHSRKEVNEPSNLQPQHS